MLFMNIIDELRAARKGSQSRYFEAASMYKAFLQTGDTERAAKEKEKMDAAYEEMGDWNIAADSIREKLGLE